MNPLYTLVPFNYYSDSRRLLIKRLGKTLAFRQEKALAVMYLLQLMNQAGSFSKDMLDQHTDENIPGQFVEDLLQLLEANGFIRPSEEKAIPQRLEIPYQELGEVVKEQRFIIVGINRLSVGIAELLQKYQPTLSFQLISFEGLDFPQTPLPRQDWADNLYSFDQWVAGYQPSDDDFIIVPTVFGNKNGLREVNRRLFAKKAMYLPIMLLDYQLEIGPLCIPGKTPCYECVYKRFLSHFDDTEEVESFNKMLEQNAPHLIHFSDAVLFSAATGVSTLQVLNYLSGNPSLIQSGYQLDWNITTNTSKSHRILKNPLCKVCSRKQDINSTNYLLNMIQVDDAERN